MLNSSIGFEQRTVAKSVYFVGKGLHSGRVTNMIISPASSGSGITFFRTDNNQNKPLKAQVINVGNTDLCTMLGSSNNVVGTVEHLMGALAYLGINNADITLNSPEVPILDGSALQYVEKLKEAGFKKLKGRREYFIVKKDFEIEENGRIVRVEKSEQLKVSCHIDYPSFIGKASVEVILNNEGFEKFLGARTFCHLQEIEKMRSMGLALGGSLDNAVVVDGYKGVLNPEGLRFKNEFAYHKILDFVGDMCLFPAPIIGHFTLVKAGHALHSKFMAELLKKRFEYLLPVNEYEDNERVLNFNKNYELSTVGRI